MKPKPRPRYIIRPRADGDGFTLVKDDRAISGGSLMRCMEAFLNDGGDNSVNLTREVVNKIYKLCV